MVTYGSIGLIHIVLVVLSFGRLRAIHQILLLPLQTRKRVGHVEHARTNRCPLQEILQVVSPTPGRESHPGFIDSAGPDSGSPPRHCRVRKTPQTRGELSTCTLRGSAGWREFPPTIFLRA